MVKKGHRNIFYKTILCSIIILVLTGCSTKETIGKVPSINDIDEKIRETVDVSDMNLGDKDKLKKLYDIDKDDLEDFLLYIPSTNIQASEIAILKVKDAAEIDEVMDKVSTRIESQATNFKDYLPEEYFLIEKHVLKTKDNYILFIISEDAETIEDIFDRSFK